MYICVYINDVLSKPAIKHKKKLKFFFKNVRIAKVILSAL